MAKYTVVVVVVVVVDVVVVVVVVVVSVVYVGDADIRFFCSLNINYLKYVSFWLTH